MAHEARTPYQNIARVVKTQGLKGEMVVRYLTGLPLSVPSGAIIWFNPPSLRGIRSARVAYLSDDFPEALLELEGVSSIDDVEDLVGKTILARREDLEQEQDWISMIGREVICSEHGCLGTVTDEFWAGAANEVWQVEGPFGEVLIPVIDEVVLDMPQDPAEPIRVHLLPGLIDE